MLLEMQEQPKLETRIVDHNVVFLLPTLPEDFR